MSKDDKTRLKELADSGKLPPAKPSSSLQPVLRRGRGGSHGALSDRDAQTFCSRCVGAPTHRPVGAQTDLCFIIKHKIILQFT